MITGPGITVVMPCYNKARFVRQSIASLISQSFSEFELIVVDDQSTDGSAQIVRAMSEKDRRIVFESNAENKGANYCRNLGIERATGEYIIFFDADDVLHNSCLQRRFDYMKANPHLDFSVHTLEIFNTTPGDNSFRWLPSSNKPLWDFLSHDLPWQTMQPIWKSDFLKKTARFDESFKRLQDVEFHTRVLLTGKARYALNPGEPDCYYRTDYNRINYGNFGFMERWVSSALQYCSKFMNLVSEENKKYLLGTIYQTYLSLLLAFKDKKISRMEFDVLENKITSHKLVKEMNRGSLLVLKVMKNYNLHFFRIPGLNRGLKKYLIHG